MGRQYRGGSGKRYTGEDSIHKNAEDVNDSLAQYYFDLYHSGIKISERGLSILQQRGFIESPKRHEPAKPTSLGDTVEYDYKYFGIDPKTPVKKRQWIAHNGNPLQPNDEFVLWVDSQFHGMSRAIKNKQFELYKLQAKQWLEDDDKISNHITRDEKIRFLLKERNRCMNNSLYGLNKYLWMKEGEVTQGKLKYEAWECQAAVLWVMDCGFSSFTGKLRQVGLTTTILGRAEMRARLRRNYFIKFITENVKKAEEIFEDKLKYAYSEQPEWFKTTVHNDAPQVFKYMFKDKKGSMKGSNSRVQVEAPYTTAINGGSPNEVIVDESGNINILSSMLNEGRPAMFWINPNTGVWEMRRQVTSFGTAGDMKKGDGQFESEFRAAVEKWKERDFSYGFVPIFIDAFAKPGITKERYEEEKSNYYAKAKNRVDGEKLRIQFHQHYPITIDDMFLPSSNTLIPLIEINDNIEKIWNLPAERQIQYGEMVPIYDTSCPTPDLYTPYKIIGASFKPLRIGDPNITVIMFMPPQDGWKNRYFQGTDPISSSTGNSDMVAAIWDSHLNVVPVVMKFRGRDHKYCFLQSMLLGLFYDKNIKDLCEGNIGQDYIDFKEYHGFKSTLLHNNRLPKYLQVTTGGIGIRKLTHNAPYILTKTREIAEHYADGIFIEPFWSQLKTYTEKINDKGYTSYATQNPQIYRDDVIDAVTYAFINAECHSNNLPSSIYDAPKLKKPKMKYVLTDDGRLALKRM